MFKSLAGLSHARPRRTARPDKRGTNNDLHEPLIPFEQSAGHEEYDTIPSTSDEGPPPPADWSYLVNLLSNVCGETFNYLYAALSSCFGLWGPATLPPLHLSEQQTRRLEELRSRLAVQYDGSNADHEAQLQELWHLAFPEEPYGGPKCARWKDMGWQNEDPSSDFRGGGLLSLQTLVYMGKHYAPIFDRLHHKRQGHRSDWEYPFGAAGVSLLFTLSQLLDLRNAAGQPNSVPGRNFCALLEIHDHALEELFVAAYDLLDSIWLDTKASYMQFPEVMKSTQQRVALMLSNRPQTVEEMRQMLSS